MKLMRGLPEGQDEKTSKLFQRRAGNKKNRGRGQDLKEQLWHFRFFYNFLGISVKCCLSPAPRLVQGEFI
ncbi:MAG: hypothetical protein ABIH45_06935 [Candidatus Omnitrophota bacterium]